MRAFNAFICASNSSMRSSLAASCASSRLNRVVFFVHEGRIGVVHGFIKNTQKTPVADLELARKRMKEMQA
jgi:phage-related protein